MNHEPEPSPEQEPSSSGGLRAAMEILAVAFVFPVAVYLGFWLGGKAGAWLGAPTLGAIAGGILGAVAGFLELHQVLSRGSKS